MPPLYTLTLKESRHEHGDIWTFVFTPEEEVPFEAGQYVHLRLSGLDEGRTHEFSISSAPEEEDISFTTHVSESPYKQRLASLAVGEKVELFKIKGDLILPRDGTPLVCIAGGIGITPFHSLMRHARMSENLTRITLIHVGHSPYLFETELAQMPYEQYRIGREDVDDTLERVTALQPDSLYYVVGSPQFITAVTEKLSLRGIPPEKIKVDDWGY